MGNCSFHKSGLRWFTSDTAPCRTIIQEPCIRVSLMATSPASNTDRERLVRGPGACGSGSCCQDPEQTVWTWEASAIFPRKLVKPPVYKGFSICYNFCTFPPAALGNMDVCIPRGFLSPKCLFSPTDTTVISQSLHPGSSQGESCSKTLSSSSRLLQAS